MTDIVTGKGFHSQRACTGIIQLDNLLGPLQAGENVLWYDGSGRLLLPFCKKFVHHCLSQRSRLILVTFDQAADLVLRRLSCDASDSNITVVDCFSHGIGAVGLSDVQQQSERSSKLQCGLITVRDPKSIDHLVAELSKAMSSPSQPVRFVVHGWTEMTELWDGEKGLLDFFGRCCRTIREVGGVAYWIVEKIDRVTNIQSQLNQTAQIAIELLTKQGKAFLVPIRAENRPPQVLKQRQNFFIKGDVITFPYEQRSPGNIDLGRRLREVRMKRGLSQAEIADRIGVSASTISQIENNLIFPSLSNFLEIAEMLRVDPSFLLKGDGYYDEKEVVFPRSRAIDVTPASLPKGSVTVRSYTREYSDSRAELFLIEIARNVSLNSHFFKHKGEEIGCLLSGRLVFRLGGRDFQLRPGDVVRFVSEIPDHWENLAPAKAVLFWAKIR